MKENSPFNENKPKKKHWVGYDVEPPEVTEVMSKTVMMIKGIDCDSDSRIDGDYYEQFERKEHNG